jgi:flagellar basal body-associated protein FliL
MKMETYTETPQGVIAEDNFTNDVSPAKKRKLRILYISLGVGIVIVVAGIVLLLMR